MSDPMALVAERYAAFYSELDCGDSSCLFKARGSGGQHTNGGCRCHDKHRFGFLTRRLLWAVAQLPGVKDAAAEPADDRKERKDAREQIDEALRHVDLGFGGFDWLQEQLDAWGDLMIEEGIRRGRGQTRAEAKALQPPNAERAFANRRFRNIADVFQRIWSEAADRKLGYQVGEWLAIEALLLAAFQAGIYDADGGPEGR